MLRLKTTLIILLFLFCNKICFSQNFRSQIHAGLNFSQVDGDKYAGYNQFGINGGFTFYRQLKNDKNIGFEINYSSKGSRKKTTQTNPDIFKLRINYICIPVFAEFNKLVKSYDKLSLKAGLSGNIFINAKTDFGFGWQKTEFSPLEISGIIGIAHQIDNNFSINIIHENSLYTIEKKLNQAQYYAANRRGIFNRLITMSVYYKL